MYSVASTEPISTQLAAASADILSLPDKETKGYTALAELFLHLDKVTSAGFSRAASKLFDRPVLVVHLDELSHAPPPPFITRNFTSDELDTRVNELQRMAHEALPEAHDRFWSGWEWRKTSAFITEPDSDCLRSIASPARDTASVITPRGEGPGWTQAAVVFSSDRRWSNAERWSNLTGLGADLENYPKGIGARIYVLAHELLHVVQRRPDLSDTVSFALRWATENDADDGALKVMGIMAKHPATSRELAAGLEETIAAVKHARAINGFRDLAPPYWNALALNDNERSRCATASPTPEQCWLSGIELQWRVYTRLAGMDRPGDSREVQTMFQNWLEGPLPDRDLNSRLTRAFGGKISGHYDWENYNRVNLSLPVLKDVVNSGEITVPLTARNAELVLKAGKIFCPSQLQEYAPSLRSTPVFAAYALR